MCNSAAHGCRFYELCPGGAHAQSSIPHRAPPLRGELNPIIDPTYVSAMNANRIVRECLTGVAMRKMGLTCEHYLSPLTEHHGEGRR